MNQKKSLTIYLVVVVSLLVVTALLVHYIDPFFHYHKPLSAYFYTLDNERSQNDGIAKHFDYDAVATGTSLTANSKISEVNALFDTDAIKLQFSGASFYEINQNLETVFKNHDPKLVIRCLDMAYFRDDPELLRIDLGEYPTYLYDENPWNDVKYLLNRDVIFSRCVPMVIDAAARVPGGVTNFDDYGNWSEGTTYGASTVLAEYELFGLAPESPELTEEEAARVRENIEKNVVALTKAHPETTFYYYISPYSAAWWGQQYENGDFFKAIGAERIAVEEILTCENARLFSFNLDTDLTTDLNNYKDALHFGEWINSELLRRMAAGEYELTAENVDDYFAEEIAFYSGFAYNSLFLQ